MNIDDSKINVFISSADFTLQNVAMKIGIPVIGIDGKIIKRIKNYILKCASCTEFIYDTKRVFCEKCGNNITMKIGFSIDNEGNMKIFDKQPEARLRGKIVINLIYSLAKFFIYLFLV
jgi:RNA-binding protein NOB1